MKRGLAIAALALCACQTTYVAHAHDVRGLVMQERFADALKAEQQFPYPPGDRILALLNQGALLHDAGRFEESNRALLEAEDLLADFYRRSAGGEAARSLISGTSGDFLAEDYERILIYVYTAQNYLALGRRDDALVEVRRLTGKLGVLADVKGHGRRYQGDGFAQWLSGLLFEDGGQPNDALISFKAALAAFPKAAVTPELRGQLCADAYRAAKESGLTAEEVSGCQENDAASAMAAPLGDDGEVVLLHAGGLVAARTEKRSNCGFLPDGVLWCYQEGEQREVPAIKLVSIAVPQLQPISPQIAGATLLVDGKPTPTAVVEDVTSIAMQTLQDRLDEYQRQATTRALARLAASTGAGVGAGKLASKSGGDQGAAVGLLVGALANAALSETEEADKRSWFTLPAFYGMARARLPAGLHAIRVELLDVHGQVLRTVDFGQVQLERGRRNFLGVRSGR